ncbi:hypothetical protein EOD39_10139 [Acipenser ruthenus]|uniref:Uncharacterized protein n=1 Tax=Acipenser ruthenus TaxID=7906 RepID=A0A662YUL7_ACIRT|nr:hypothetical protein EOD39_10139 [Acipenser ruthenus]
MLEVLNQRSNEEERRREAREAQQQEELAQWFTPLVERMGELCTSGPLGDPAVTLGVPSLASIHFSGSPGIMMINYSDLKF